MKLCLAQASLRSGNRAFPLCPFLSELWGKVLFSNTIFFFKKSSVPDGEFWTCKSFFYWEPKNLFFCNKSPSLFYFSHNNPFFYYIWSLDDLICMFNLKNYIIFLIFWLASFYWHNDFWCQSIICYLILIVKWYHYIDK